MINPGKGWWLAGLVLLAGCSRQDTESLARAGRKALELTEEATGEVQEKLASGWQAFKNNLDELGLDCRVSSRLRWDQELADSPIEVHAQGAIVELKGKIKSEAQRERAKHLASSTVGVEKVIDGLVLVK